MYVETIETNHTRAGSSLSEFVSFVNDCGYELWTINEQGEPDNPLSDCYKSPQPSLLTDRL
jgi:hypothetical protein